MSFKVGDKVVFNGDVTDDLEYGYAPDMHPFVEGGEVGTVTEVHDDDTAYVETENALCDFAYAFKEIKLAE